MIFIVSIVHRHSQVPSTLRRALPGFIARENIACMHIAGNNLIGRYDLNAALGFDRYVVMV